MPLKSWGSFIDVLHFFRFNFKNNVFLPNHSNTGSTDFNIIPRTLQVPSPLKPELEDGTPISILFLMRQKSFKVEKPMDPVQISPSKSRTQGKHILRSIENPYRNRHLRRVVSGINNVIRTLVQLYHNYGFRHPRVPLLRIPRFIPSSNIVDDGTESETVQDIHNIGGSILSSSRGPQDIGEIVDALNAIISVNFCIGGDGTLRGAHEIAMEVEKRGRNIGILEFPND